MNSREELLKNEACEIVTEWLGMFDPAPLIDFQQSEFLQGAIVTALKRHAQTQRTVSQEALDWAASESEKVEAYKAANPDWQNQTRPAREVLAQGARDEDAIKLADEMQSLGYPEFGDCLSLKAYNLILKALRASSLTSTDGGDPK